MFNILLRSGRSMIINRESLTRVHSLKPSYAIQRFEHNENVSTLLMLFRPCLLSSFPSNFIKTHSINLRLPQISGHVQNLHN